jgi:hypothetical protein
LVVENLEKEQPGQLGYTLRIAINARVLAHDVLDGFDEGGADSHGYLVKRRESGMCSALWCLKMKTSVLCWQSSKARFIPSLV